MPLRLLTETEVLDIIKASGLTDQDKAMLEAAVFDRLLVNSIDDPYCHPYLPSKLDYCPFCGTGFDGEDDE